MRTRLGGTWRLTQWNSPRHNPFPQIKLSDNRSVPQGNPGTGTGPIGNDRIGIGRRNMRIDAQIERADNLARGSIELEHGIGKVRGNQELFARWRGQYGETGGETENRVSQRVHPS